MSRDSLLLVEDEYLIALGKKQWLELHGFSVSVARNGMQALNAVEEAIQKGQQFDAVLMDLHLGSSPDGIALTRTLQLLDSELLIVFHSAHPQSSIAERAPDLAELPFISKTIPASALPKLMAQHIKASASR